jgi:hypothetical protein
MQRALEPGRAPLAGERKREAGNLLVLVLEPPGLVSCRLEVGCVLALGLSFVCSQQYARLLEKGLQRKREGSKRESRRTPGVSYRGDPVEALAQSQVLFFEGHEVIRYDGSREDLCPRGSSGVRGRVDGGCK